jgi:single-strand DNA-binding protein
MVNKAILVGRIGKDPVITQAGQSRVAKFSLATEERRKDQSGVTQTKTEWHYIQAWGKLADICERYLKKGSLIYIEGKIQTSEWDDKTTGEKRKSTEIVANKMVMLGGQVGDKDDKHQDPDKDPGNSPARNSAKHQVWAKMQAKKMSQAESINMWKWAEAERIRPQQLLDDFGKFYIEWKDHWENDQSPLDDDIPF